MPEYRVTGEVTEVREVQMMADSSADARAVFEDYFDGAEIEIYKVTKVNDDN